MTKSMKLRGLTVAALAATALFAAQPAAANTIELTGWWAGSSAVTIDFNGINWHTGNPVDFAAPEVGEAGGFSTTNNGGTPFQSFCVDIFHTFGFPTTSTDTLVMSPATLIGTTAARDLARLYTAHQSAIDSHSSTNMNESAFQLAVWEIVNERSGSYSLDSGDFSATSASGVDIARANSWLAALSTVDSTYTANFWVVDRSAAGGAHAQDVVVFTPVPEPQTYAMMLVGLGLLGFSARRKNQNLG